MVQPNQFHKAIKSMSVPPPPPEKWNVTDLMLKLKEKYFFAFSECRMQAKNKQHVRPVFSCQGRIVRQEIWYVTMQWQLAGFAQNHETSKGQVDLFESCHWKWAKSSSFGKCPSCSCVKILKTVGSLESFGEVGATFDAILKRCSCTHGRWNDVIWVTHCRSLSICFVDWKWHR